MPRLRWVTLLLVLVGLLPAAVWVIQGYRHDRERELERAGSELLNTAALAAMSQNQLIEGARQILATVAAGPSVRREDLDTLCIEFLQNIMTTTPGYNSVGVLDLQGQSRCLSGVGAKPFNAADRRYFREAMLAPPGTLVGGEYIVGRTSGRKALVFAVPVHDTSGKLKAVAYAGVNLELADARLKALPLPEPMFIRLADRQGLLLGSLRLDFDAIGKPLPDPALARAIGQGQSGKLDMTDAQGTRWLHAVVAVPVSNGKDSLYVVVSAPRDAVLAPALNRLQTQLALLGAASLLGLGLAWQLGRRWLELPIQQLLARMQHRARGEADPTRPPSARPPELVDLDAGFSTLLQALDDQNLKLLRAQQIVRIGFYDINFDRGVMQGSEEGFEVLGLRAYGREITLEAYQALIHPDDRSIIITFRERMRTCPGLHRMRYRKFFPSGELRWIEAVAESRADPAQADAPIADYFGAVQDVTEQERSRRLFSVQSRINDAIVRCDSEQDLFDKTCAIAVNEGLMRLAWVGQTTGPTRKMQVLAAAGPAMDYLDAALQVPLDVDRGASPVVVALRDAAYTVCNDIAAAPLLQPWHGLATQHRLQGIAVIPIKRDGQVHAALVLMAEAKGAFGPDDDRVLRAIGDNLSHALTALNADMERRMAEQRVQAQLARTEMLNRITRAIGDRLDLDSVFRVVAETLQTQLPADFVAVALYEPGSQEVDLCCLVGGSASAQQAGLAQGSRLPVQESGLARCVAGELVYLPELQGLDATLCRQLQAAGQRSVVLAPLQVEHTVFGLVIAARNTADAFSSGECEFLRQLGAQVALAASQAQLHQTLQRTFDELQRSQQTALQQERLRALGQMASGIAHDINNAIAPVALYTEALLDDEPGLSDRTRQYLQVIQRSIDDVAETVARMREVYRPQPAESHRAAVSLNTLVQQVLALTRARWRDMPQQSGIAITVHTELADNLPPVQAADGELREALTNLVFNAVDALPQGGQIGLRSCAGEGEVRIEVSDNGMGMDEATRLRCLEPFFTTKGERGTGLGLAMVYGTMQRHGGRIEVDSQPGQGTTVRLALPTSSAPTRAPLPLITPLRSLRILLIDDDPLVLASLAEALQIDAHQIITAQGGGAGIKAFADAIARDQPFDAVITDLGMPDVDGRQVAQAVKSARPATRVLMLTGWGRRMQQDDERPENVDVLLSKPPSLTTLRRALAGSD